MADLSKLSDSDLRLLASGNVKMMSAEGLKTIAALPNVNQKPVKIGKDAFADMLRETLRETDWATRNIAGAGTALTNLWEGAKQLVGQSNQDNIANYKVIREEAPVGAFVGDAALTAVPFGMAGNSIKAAGAVGGGYSLLQPVQADNATDAIKGKALNTAIGVAAGSVGQAVANKLMAGPFSNRIHAIEQKVKDKAAQIAESETASARSAAGHAAQNAYRQLEHLRELGANRPLTAQESLTVQMLERELAEKSLDNLLPAAALKQSTSDAYKEAMKTEAQRAADYAAAKLSGQEIKDQFMARLKRYGPAALGGALGHMMLPGVGTLGGIAGGLYLRPALRSMVNFAKNPAVQYGLLNSANNSLTTIAPTVPVTSLLLSEGLLGAQ